MPTFLALQCYHCNTMQVKHEKKSSNKWTCSLCNEKQSVRKVFATSMAAKDIRKFVQQYNLSRNGAKDLALAQLVVNLEEQRSGGFVHGDDDVFCGEDNRVCCDILSDKVRCQEVILESKWNEYLPQGDTIYAESSEDAMDDVEFVTVIPETYARRANGKTRTAPNKYIAQYGVEQKRTRVTEKPSSRPLESIREHFDAAQRANDLPYQCTQKDSLSSSPQVPNPACIPNASAYKTPQRLVACASVAGVQLGEREWIPPSLMKSKVRRTEGKKPVPTYESYLGEEGQKIVKEEKPVSRWAKYLDEVAFSEVALESCAKGVGESSIWALGAASNTHHLNDALVKTELEQHQSCCDEQE